MKQQEIHSSWAPLGAERIKEMVDDNFFKGIRFFRVINGFMAQFGIQTSNTKRQQQNNYKSTPPVHWLTSHSQQSIHVQNLFSSPVINMSCLCRR